MDLYVGCPIWANKGWVGSLYPEGTKPSEFLAVYARQLATVEGNTTFYAVPSPATLQHWVEQTPPTFRFCPKLPRAISHAGSLVKSLAEAKRFYETMSLLGSRLGPCFLQLPPQYAPSMAGDLQEFLDHWPSHAPLAVEVRHAAWFEAPHHETLQAMLTRHQMARVMIDTRPIRGLDKDPILRGSVYERLLKAREQKPNLPIVSEPTAAFTFLRYIGHPHLEHNAPYLDEWADKLADWLQGGLDTYVFCHCPDERLDPQLCRELHQRVSAKVPIAPLPQAAADSAASQPRLF
jgi:uncharacterized protein YecE (DUF72 family)